MALNAYQRSGLGIGRKRVLMLPVALIYHLDTLSKEIRPKNFDFRNLFRIKLSLRDASKTDYDGFVFDPIVVVNV